MKTLLIIVAAIAAFSYYSSANNTDKVGLYKGGFSDADKIATFENHKMNGFNLAFSNCQSMVDAINSHYPADRGNFACQEIK